MEHTMFLLLGVDHYLRKNNGLIVLEGDAWRGKMWNYFPRYRLANTRGSEFERLVCAHGAMSELAA